MSDQRDKIRQKMLDAEQKAAYWLHLGNRALERGDTEKAERHYDRSQRWHDEMIRQEELLHSTSADAMKRIARIRRCRDDDKDPHHELPVEDQRWCLFSDDGKTLRGRHKNRGDAKKQDRSLRGRRAALERLAVIQKCRKKDQDDRPLSEQVWCLYTKDGPEKGRLLGRHKTKDDALRQERAIHVNAAASCGGDQTMSKRTAKKWRSLPKGWTQKSAEEFWDSIGGSVSKCIKEIEGVEGIDDAGAFCASLADRIEGTGWRHEKRSSARSVVAMHREQAWSGVRYVLPDWASFNSRAGDAFVSGNQSRFHVQMVQTQDGDWYYKTPYGSAFTFEELKADLEDWAREDGTDLQKPSQGTPLSYGSIRQQIERLGIQAGMAGDMAMVAVAELAIWGNTENPQDLPVHVRSRRDAVDECTAVIHDAQVANQGGTTANTRKENTTVSTRRRAPKRSAKNAQLPDRIKVAGHVYRKARFMEPMIEYGEWVIVDGPYGGEVIPAEYVNSEDYERLKQELDAEGTGGEVSVEGTSLRDFMENNVIYEIDLVKGYGAYMSAPGYMDRTDTVVFDTEEEALEYLKEEHMDPEEYPEFYEDEDEE